MLCDFSPNCFAVKLVLLRGWYISILNWFKCHSFHRLLHGIFDISPGIGPRPPYQARGFGMGRVLIPEPK